MICWDHLVVWEGRKCGCSHTKNMAKQSEFFKALVAGYCANPIPGSPVEGAEEIMSEIERRVEAGTLFVEAQK